MCGIVGLIERSPEPLGEHHAIHAALATLTHRGPDDARVDQVGRASFGTARLAMVDRPTSVQPRRDATGQHLLAFNGEVYNYGELRAELTAHGYSFSTDGDTEVVSAALAWWGEAALARLKGQFAIASWDQATQRLLLARDRFGIVPLFWTTTSQGVAFASEVKALQGLGLQPALSVPDLVDVGVLWGTHPGRSVFAGVHTVRPGGYVIVDDAGAREGSYWNYDYADERDGRSLDEQAVQLRELLVQAVVRRLPVYDDPAVLLSGGLDSTAVLALLREVRPTDRIASYSMRFTRPALDEESFQSLAADAFATDHKYLECGDDSVAAALVEAVWHAEQPLTRTASASSIGLAATIERAGSRAVLSGEGADELLCGYDLFKLAAVRDTWNSQEGPPSGLSDIVAQEVTRGRAVPAAFYEEGVAHRDDPLFSHLPRWKGASRILRYLAPDHRAAISVDGVLEAVRERLPGAYYRWSAVEQAQYLEASYFLPSSLLASQCDRPYMAHSIEARYPFLDEDVVDFALTLPQESKLAGVVEKAVLKRAVAADIPAAIRDRPKQPYTAPEGDVFRSAAGERLMDVALSHDALVGHGVFDPKRVTWLADKLRHGRTSFHDDLALLWIVSIQVLADTYTVAR